MSKSLGNIMKREVNTYAFSNPDRRMLKTGAKEDLKLHILSSLMV